jgi:hypothetical protein
LPFFTRNRDAVVMKLEVFARSTEASSYHLVVTYVDIDGEEVVSTEVTMSESATYGGLNKATIGLNDAGMALDEVDIGEAVRLRLKRGTAAAYTSLATDPDELEDVFLVMHYKLQDK